MYPLTSGLKALAMLYTTVQNQIISLKPYQVNLLLNLCKWSDFRIKKKKQPASSLDWMPQRLA